MPLVKKLKMKQTGIISYGVVIPSFRIKVEEIAAAWNTDPEKIKKSLQIKEKSVADSDEDSATLAIEASYQAIDRITLDPQKIGAIYLGSESHPYSVKPTATIVGDAIKAGPEYLAADLEFACKAGSAGMQIVNSLIKSEQINYGLAIGSDTAQGAPGDPLEYSAASGAAAYLFGNNPQEIIANLDHTVSYTTDTPDFWRATNAKFPNHGGRFTGKPGYYQHVISATELLLKKTKTKIEDYTHIVLHMPNGSFPRRAAAQLKITTEQLKNSLIVEEIGNTYSACSLIGLANVLDQAKAGEKILLSSYGSGAGADSFAFTVTENIKNYKKTNSVQDLINNKNYINYSSYLKMRKKILQH